MRKRSACLRPSGCSLPASDEGWSVSAYAGVVKDGCLYGRGALDCKGTMYVQLQAVEELQEEGFVPPCDV